MGVAVALAVAGFASAHAAEPTPTPGPSIGWTDVSGGRFREVQPKGSGTPGFTLLEPGRTGIAFTNHLSDANAANNRILENGSGVALGDVDGDGWCDVYFCRLEGDNALYRNRGDGTFEDLTARAGVACPGQASTGAVFADLDGDGDLDLLVNGLGAGTRMFRNDGQGHFTEDTTGRLVRRFGATSLALADMDGDGDLDLYVTNYRTDTFRDDPPGLRVEAQRDADGRITVKPEGRFVPLVPRSGAVEVIERGERDFLYLNTGQGRLAPVSWTAGAFTDEDGKPLTEAPTDWGLAVQFRDFTGDGRPDLYVCNDFAYWPDRIWINEEGRRFRAADRTRFRSQSLSSMSVDVADVDRDGRDDLFVADMVSRQAERRAWQRPNTLEGLVNWPKSDPLFRPEVTHNTLHWARPDGTFAELARHAGVAATEWTWSAVFLDVDLDGWEDLLLATGNNHDVQHADVLEALSRVREARTAANRARNLARFPRLPTGLLAYRNQRDLTFADTATPWRFDLPGLPTALALADLDNDGDLDVIASQVNGPAWVLRNDSAAPRISVRLRGRAPNTRGIGARIRLTGGPVEQQQEMIAGGRYLSGDDTVRTFAATPDRAHELHVTWRSGRTSVLREVRANRTYELDEPEGAPVEVPPQPSPPAAFDDDTARLGHRHHHEEFDDFARQSLLPRKLSTERPATGWADLDGDGRDELVVGAGHHGTNAYLRRLTNGAWTPLHHPLPVPPGQRALASLLAIPGPRGASLLAAWSNWENADPQAPVLTGTGQFAGVETALLGLHPGPVAAADLDGDGRPEVFVGQRSRPGRWPDPGPSFLLRQREGMWRTDPTPLDAGLVTGALFTDLDDDGRPDLVTVAEAGAPRVWWNRGGRLEPARLPGLTDRTGWWRSLAAGDFDGDGRLDLVGGNWGSNWRLDTRDPAHPGTELAWGEYAGPDRVEPLLGSWDPGLKAVVAWRERKVVTAALPWTAAAFPTYAEYGRATLTGLLGTPGEAARRVQVATDRSVLWLNRGDHFLPRELPTPAQLSPVSGLAVADFNGDGHEDLILSQNFFATDAESSRQDAGQGLWLVGDGTGGFRVESLGVNEPGEGRGVAVGDVDADGAPDLAMGVFQGPTRLWRNRAAGLGKTYYTVRVAPAAPLGGVGTRVRVKLAGSWSAARETRAGNGSGGQDAAVLAFAGAAAPTAIRIRWSDGRQEERAWPAGVRHLPLERGPTP
jgi:hypothetical protein